MAEIKQIAQSFQGQVTDFTNETLPKDFFIDAKNIRLNTNKYVAKGGFTLELGNKKVISLKPIEGFVNVMSKEVIRYYDARGNTKELVFNSEEVRDLFFIGNKPLKSGKQEILEIIDYEDGLIIFSTDSDGKDCIWSYIVKSEELSLEYVRDMGFTKESRLKALYNYENKLVRKVYWIDGKSQLRFINLENSIKNGDYEELIDIPLENINQVGLFNISQPEVEVLSNGGQHTSGTIQYAYNLYKINGNQTKLSPLSMMVSLGNGDVNGGDVNEKVTDMPKVTLTNLDSNYTNIRLYAIKYSTFNTVPDIYIINDSKIDDHALFTMYDTGVNRIQDVSLEQLVFIGSDPVFPKEITSKDNHLFLANYEESSYELKNLDTRMFSFRKNTNTITFSDAYDVVKDKDGDVIDVTPAPHAKSFSMSKSDLTKMPDKRFTQNFIDKCNSTTNGILGMEGMYFTMTMERFKKPINVQYSNVLKDNELYRYSIKFYNSYGQYTEPMFLGDYYNSIEEYNKSNITGYIIEPKFTIKSSFKDYLNNKDNFLDNYGNYDERLKPIGYKIMRAIRRPEDRLSVVQGLVNTMISCNPTRASYKASEETKKEVMEAGYKMPWFMRTRSDKSYPIMGYKHGMDIGETGNPNGIGKRNTEVFTSTATAWKRASTYQYTTMMQLYSPELTFNEVNAIDTKFFRLLHTVNSYDAVFASETNTTTLEKDLEVKVLGRLSPRANEKINGLIDMEVNELQGDPNYMFDFSLVGPTDGKSAHSSQFYRDYAADNAIYNPFRGNKILKTLGMPVLVEKGQGITSYNGNSKYTFTNKFDRFRTDYPKDRSGTSDPKGSSAITKLNSFNERNITFVESREKPLEDILRENLNDINTFTDSPVIEYVRPISHYYMDNMYGGNKGNRLGSEYVEIGTYRNLYNDKGVLDITDKIILNPGDTFISDFEFQKLSCDQEYYTDDAYNTVEIVKFRVETSIDLMRRSDLSRYSWDSFFMPKYLDYTKYNRVYSQQDNIFKNTNNAYNFKSNVEYGNRVIASRQKSSGELIDSWTDLMVNNIIDLDGKYGGITNLISTPNGLVALQNAATSIIAVNPRVQTVATDGVSIELGTGAVLYDYRYVSTTHGSRNRWNTIATKTGLYFYDDINKTICVFNGESVTDHIKAKGIVSYFKEKILELDINDNPLLGNGISLGYSNDLNDIYFVFHNKYCFVYNEAEDRFMGLMSYNSPLFKEYGINTYSLDKDNLNELYLHSAGVYNKFYDKQEDSFIEFLVNPEPLSEGLLTNISVKLNDSYTEDSNIAIWDSIEVKNDYQSTGIIPLVSRVNYRKMNRLTHITIPREKNTRNRMRDTWHKVKFRTINKDNKLLLSNSMVISYKPLPLDVRE